MKAVILAVGMGTRLRNITNNEIPKPFLEINGLSLIERSINKLNLCGIEEIIIVVGHLKEFFIELSKKYTNIRLVENKDYSITGSMASFYCAKGLIDDDILLLEGDLIYEKKAIEELLKSEKKDALLLSEDKKAGDDYYFELKDNKITSVLKNSLSGEEKLIGELTGITKLSKELSFEMFEYFKLKNNPKFGYEYCLAELSEKREIGYLKIDGILWSEIDDENQLERVISIIYPEILKKGEK